ncbi:hypothetical protein HB848_08615 [Listeria rocourtiae]|uniref:hypothetical protein n=1 Tax=Listeria rocourtiae TaxID=647910 RepID=UPI001625602B|nr:hypothetical protein [Listeria rocourtiae]MBC1435401.1 hypothetical protein [Listeria rocourtiae]
METIKYREFYNQIKKDGVFLDYVLAKISFKKLAFDKGISYRPEKKEVFFLLEGAFLLLEDSHCHHYQQKKDFFYWPKNLEQFELRFITKSQVLVFDEEEFLMTLEKEGVLSYFFFLTLENKLDFHYLRTKRQRTYDEENLKKIFLLFIEDCNLDVSKSISLPSWVTSDVLSAISCIPVSRVRSLMASLKEQDWLSTKGQRKIMTPKLIGFLLLEKNKYNNYSEF